MIKFSIIIPIYNGEKYLNQCLNSIINQKYENIEVLLIDDGSKDSSLDICNQYALKDSRFKVVHKKNEGPVIARKIGALHATGDYVICIDADDYIIDGYFKFLNNEIQRCYPDMICLGFADDKGNEFNNQIKNGYYDSDKIKEKVIVDRSSPFPNQGCLLYSIWSKVVKTYLFVQTIEQVPSHLFFGEDMFQIALLTKTVKKIVIVNEHYYIYRTNDESITRSIDENTVNKYLNLCDMLPNAIGYDKTRLFARLAYYDLLSKNAKSLSFKEFREFYTSSLLNSLRNYDNNHTGEILTFKFRIKRFIDNYMIDYLKYLLFRKF